MKEPKIIKNFKDQVISLFESEEEFNKFLYTPDHIWSSTGDDKTPYYWLVKGRRPDRLEYAVRTVKELKSTVIITD